MTFCNHFYGYFSACFVAIFYCGGCVDDDSVFSWWRRRQGCGSFVRVVVCRANGDGGGGVSWVVRCAIVLRCGHSGGVAGIMVS